MRNELWRRRIRVLRRQKKKGPEGPFNLLIQSSPKAFIFEPQLVRFFLPLVRDLKRPAFGSRETFDFGAQFVEQAFDFGGRDCIHDREASIAQPVEDLLSGSNGVEKLVGEFLKEIREDVLRIQRAAAHPSTMIVMVAVATVVATKMLAITRYSITASRRLY
jgi:hypothetical protein